MNPANISIAAWNSLADCRTGAGQQTGGPSLMATGGPEWFCGSDPYFGCSSAHCPLEAGSELPLLGFCTTWVFLRSQEVCWVTLISSWEIFPQPGSYIKCIPYDAQLLIVPVQGISMVMVPTASRLHRLQAAEMQLWFE